MNELHERIDLEAPLSGDFQAVVRLIIGGIAERVDFAFEEIDDLQLAVMVGATPSKYFHLTQALLGAGDEQAAQQAWKKAVELGIAAEKVSKLERDELDQLIQKMGPIAPPTAQL